MTSPFVLVIKLRWWLRLYLAAVLGMAELTGMKPDMAKVEWWIKHGLVLRVMPVRAVLAA